MPDDLLISTKTRTVDGHTIYLEHHALIKPPNWHVRIVDGTVFWAYGETDALVKARQIIMSRDVH